MATLEVSFWPNWPRRAVKDVINNITKDELVFNCVVGSSLGSGGAGNWEKK